MINISSKERHFDTPAISEACGKRELAAGTRVLER